MEAAAQKEIIKSNSRLTSGAVSIIARIESPSGVFTLERSENWQICRVKQGEVDLYRPYLCVRTLVH